MQVSLNWLNEFVDLSDINEKQIAHELTMSGLEVEAIEYIKPQFKNIITAKIIKIDQHPNADKLHLVTVDTGLETKTVPAILTASTVIYASTTALRSISMTRSRSRFG